LTVQRSRPKVIYLLVATVATAIAIVGMFWQDSRLTLIGSGLTLLISLPILIPAIFYALAHSPLGKHWDVTLSTILSSIVLLVLAHFTKVDSAFWIWFNSLRWDALGAVGQILIAILAVWVAWRQNQISETLTGQQNAITQQQTIDAYFQGISDLVLDDQGQMEDWPLERAIAQGRTAALVGGSDPEGRAKIIRFLSSANLLTPLKRDGKDISNTDLRWVDLSGANLIKANLSGCNLTGANLGGTILAKVKLKGADFSKVRLFYGDITTASPRDRLTLPNFDTGEHTGAVVEEADLCDAIDLSEDNRRYFCMWGGNKTRRTIPGGCDGIPNRLGR
jgi:Pentapeptide repeats (8 copies)